MRVRANRLWRLVAWRSLFVAMSGILATGLVACGGGGGGDTSAWIRIDAPTDGSSTGREVVTVSGNSAQDGTIYWYNNGASGVLPHQTICIVACITAFQGDVPLFLGGNTITVQVGNVSDSVTITRFPQVVAAGEVVMETTGERVSGATITLSGDRDSVTQTDAVGSYFFEFLRDGHYRLSASLQPPQFTGCLGFSPDSIEFDVVTDDDIQGLNFAAVQLAPCFRISGRITASTNPDFGQPGIKLTLTDADGIEYIVYSGVSGEYDFWHLAPGTYSVTPSDCFLGCATFIPATVTVTITDSDVFSNDFTRVFN
jgi:hypothetical protein